MQPSRRTGRQLGDGPWFAGSRSSMRSLPRSSALLARPSTAATASTDFTDRPRGFVQRKRACRPRSGLGFNPKEDQTTFDEPVLPDFFHEVALHRLRLGEGWADVALRRSGRKVVVDVLERSGPVRVLTTN